MLSIGLLACLSITACGPGQPTAGHSPRPNLKAFETPTNQARSTSIDKQRYPTTRLKPKVYQIAGDLSEPMLADYMLTDQQPVTSASVPGINTSFEVLRVYKHRYLLMRFYPTPNQDLEFDHIELNRKAVYVGPNRVIRTPLNTPFVLERAEQDLFAGIDFSAVVYNNTENLGNPERLELIGLNYGAKGIKTSAMLQRIGQNHKASREISPGFGFAILVPTSQCVPENRLQSQITPVIKYAEQGRSKRATLEPVYGEICID